jgi:hypothetical protein
MLRGVMANRGTEWSLSSDESRLMACSRQEPLKRVWCGWAQQRNQHRRVLVRRIQLECERWRRLWRCPRAARASAFTPDPDRINGELADWP